MSLGSSEFGMSDIHSALEHARGEKTADYLIKNWNRYINDSYTGLDYLIYETKFNVDEDPVILKMDDQQFNDYLRSRRFLQDYEFNDIASILTSYTRFRLDADNIPMKNVIRNGGSYDMVKYLIDTSGDMPQLQDMVNAGRSDMIVQYLSDYDIDLRGVNVITARVMLLTPEAIESLVDHGLGLNRIQMERSLQYLAARGEDEKIKMLIEMYDLTISPDTIMYSDLDLLKWMIERDVSDWNYAQLATAHASLRDISEDTLRSDILRMM